MRTLFKSVGAAALAAGALLAFTSVASATVVEPAGETFEATNVGATTFVTDNGTGVGLSCNVSTAQGEIPPVGDSNDNDNPDGSVFGQLTSIAFNQCTDDVLGQPVDVDTSGSGDQWTVSAMAYEDGMDTETDDTLTVGVPPGGAVLTVAALGDCRITVPKVGTTDVAAAATGDWQDGTATAPAELSIDTQVAFDDTDPATDPCNLESPAVYNGDYEVESLDSTTPITIDES